MDPRKLAKCPDQEALLPNSARKLSKGKLTLQVKKQTGFFLTENIQTKTSSCLKQNVELFATLLGS